MKLRGFIIILFIVWHDISYSNDTLCIRDLEKNIFYYKKLFILEDKQSQVTIDSLLKSPQSFKFQPNSEPKPNFGFSTSTFWFKFILRNETDRYENYILEISNPDLDNIGFFVVDNNKVKREVITGELYDVKSRDIFHRNFIFNINIEPGKTYVYYINTRNSGHAFFVPINIQSSEQFYIDDNVEQLVNWLIYGLLLFIVIFNIYLYRSTKDKVNLFYTLYVIFAGIFFFYYDGYLYFFNPPPFIEGFKWIYPSLYVVSLVSFSETFTKNDIKLKGLRKWLTPFKYVVIITAFFYLLKFPYSLITDIGLPILISLAQVIVILIAIFSFNRKYVPSHLFFLAYILVFSGMIVHELKEFNIFPSNLFTENSIKIGLSLECILLTIAVLERFRITQENAKKTIEKSYSRIEIQNKELEIINTELEKLSIVASETNNGVAIFDNNGRLEWCNAGFERFYESNIDDLIKNGKDNIQDIMPNDNILELLRSCINKKKPVSFETHVMTSRDKEKWVQTTLSPFIKSGKIKKVIAIDSDISNLKKYEKNLNEAKEKAIEADRLKSVFLANMSHEIRTPLNGILGFSDLLMIPDLSSDKRARYHEIISSNSHQLLKIIDDIMDISMIESNQLMIHKTSFNLSNLFPDALEYFKNYMRIHDKMNLNLILDGFPENTNDTIYSDPARIQQVLYSLLSNGIKFTQNGYVKFGGKIEDKFLLLYVEDSGIGIKPAIGEQIFKAFRQGQETITRSYGGTGLGLSISRGIIELLEGMIWIDFSYKGGALLCLSIPVDESVFKNGVVNSYKDLDLLKRKNILIVEDNDTDIVFIPDVFKAQKANISWIKLENLSSGSVENKPDLIILDTDKNSNDLEITISQITKDFKNLSLIALVPKLTDHQIPAIDRPGLYILQKPVNIQLLLFKCIEFLC
jgi:PAS domain S-box-containing protein